VSYRAHRLLTSTVATDRLDFRDNSLTAARRGSVALLSGRSARHTCSRTVCYAQKHPTVEDQHRWLEGRAPRLPAIYRDG
jgi:hypothetical protein